MPNPTIEHNRQLGITCPTWCTRKHRPGELEVGDIVHEREIRLLGANLDHLGVRLEQIVTEDHRPLPDTIITAVITVEGVDTAPLELNEARAIAVALLEASDEHKKSLGARRPATPDKGSSVESVERPAHLAPTSVRAFASTFEETNDRDTARTAARTSWTGRSGARR